PSVRPSWRLSPRRRRGSPSRRAQTHPACPRPGGPVPASRRQASPNSSRLPFPSHLLSFRSRQRHPDAPPGDPETRVIPASHPLHERDWLKSPPPTADRDGRKYSLRSGNRRELPPTCAISSTAPIRPAARHRLGTWGTSRERPSQRTVGPSGGG